MLLICIKETVEHSLHWFDSHLSGEISSKIIDFHDGINYLTNGIFTCLTQMTLVVISMIYLFQVHHLTLFIIIAFLIHALIIRLLLKKQLLLRKEYVKSRQETVGIINDSISNMLSIKVIGNILNELKLKLIPSINRWSEMDRKTRYYDAYVVDLIDAIITTCIWALIIYLLSYLYKNEEITSGGFTFAITMTMMISHALDIALDIIIFTINPKIATIKSSYDFINSTLYHVSDSPKAINLSKVKGNIQYEEVTFCYNDGINVLSKLNIEINAGQHVGIVGISGAGKTTFIKCLLRYFNLRTGRILIDGHDISQVSQASLRANIAVIPQDISMLHRTILENLQLANIDTDLEEIQEVCKAAKIHETIELMPKGYNTIVGERGVKLSGGQRQSIAIARAILKNAPILILDEAMSALDTPTEQLIQESINQLLASRNHTIIVIAHRLSTLINMDRILVFKDGMIIEDGTHTELLKLDGAYKIFWDAQMQCL